MKPDEIQKAASADLFAAILRSDKANRHPRPEGFTTADEFAKQHGGHIQTARRRLSAAFKGGFVERVKWNGENGSVWLYRAKQSGKKL